MDICIVKSASKDVYLKQNLEILRLPQGDSVELRYRTVWVDEDVTDYLHTDSHHSATIVFCDPPEFKLTPIRRFDLYGAHFDDDDESGAITLSGRCGAFVHPQGSAEWAQRLKLKHPGAGDPPGKFVVAFDGCPLAGDTVQQAAWQAVIDNLVQQPKYDECLFFYNNGLTTSDGNSTGPRDLEVGEKYSLTIASYNKHLGGDVLRSTGLEVVADDSVIEAELAEPKP
ncbi:MAG: hypothetical protein M1305_07360, partial [Candidatus Marsarchaeota archaeon]|nr:hypothetical protein [Candidatus Marsarchaeota archaeon]